MKLRHSREGRPASNGCVERVQQTVLEGSWVTTLCEGGALLEDHFQLDPEFKRDASLLNDDGQVNSP
jgi:hypothetical protein